MDCRKLLKLKPNRFGIVLKLEDSFGIIKTDIDWSNAGGGRTMLRFTSNFDVVNIAAGQSFHCNAILLNPRRGVYHIYHYMTTRCNEVSAGFTRF